ncbi:asparagine synthase-related protein [Homoserinimonas sp. A520]
MFFAAVLAPGARQERARAALDFHGNRLAATGWSGSIIEEEFPGGMIAWDGDASHADLLRDSARGTLLLRAGYLAADDAWASDGRHSTERHDVWGEFAAVVVRPLPDGGCEVDAFSDPAASWPIYHARRDDSLVISNDPHFIALALGLTKLSDQGVYEVLAYHHSLGVETTIDGVERLFPGDRLSASASDRGVERVRIESRAAYAYTSTGASTTEIKREALEGLRRGVAAIGPLQDGGFADATVQLSGGLDSRLTAAVLAEIFPERPDVVTVDLSNEKELVIAREVAARLGYPHRTAFLSDTSLATMRVGWLLTGGQVSPYAAAGNILSYETASRSADGRVLLIGAWPGDCLIGSYIPLLPGMTSRALRGLFIRDWADKRGRRRSDLGNSVSGAGADRVARAARRRLRRGVLESSGSTAAQAISFWAMFWRQPSFSYIAPAMLTSHVLPLTPVLARPYLDQLLRLRGAQIIGKNFYRTMISHGFPELAGIPNASTGHPVTDEPAVVTWKPSSVNDLYMSLPLFVQQVAHFLLGRFRRGSSAGDSSLEAVHWSAVLAEGGEVDTVPAGSITVQAGPGDDIHIRAVVRGLRWTVDYLEEGSASLARW